MIDGFSAAQVAGLAAFVFFAGVVDALAGGGGIITLPAYLSFGLNPALVLGTNKLASSIGTVGSALNYHRRQRLPLRQMAPGVAAAVLGSFIGARMATWIDPKWLRYLMLAVIPAVGWLVYARKSFGHEDTSHRLPAGDLLSRELSVSAPIGWYDGFFGPGTGTFFALGLSRWCGYDLLGATGRAKILNLATNVAAVVAFLLAGRVHVALGLTMAATSLAGHYVGSHLGLKKGPALIRPVVVVVCAGLFAKLLADTLR